MNIIHFVGEWFDCRPVQALLTDAPLIQARAVEHMERRHRPIGYAHFTKGADGLMGAVTGNGLHIIVRTFSNRQAARADLFVRHEVASDVTNAMQVFDDLRDDFRPLRALLHRLHRDDHAVSRHGRTPIAPTEVFSVKPPRWQAEAIAQTLPHKHLNAERLRLAVAGHKKAFP